MNLSKFIAPLLASAAMGCTINSGTESPKAKEAVRSADVASTNLDPEIEKRCAELLKLIRMNIGELEASSQFTTREADRSLIKTYIGVITGEQHGYEMICGQNVPTDDMNRVIKVMDTLQAKIDELREPQGQ